MRPIFRLLLALYASMLLTSPTPGQDIKGTAEFMADATPGFLKIHGTGGVVVGKIGSKVGDYVTATFRSEVKDYTTDLALRDRHMKERYMEMGKFPEIILSIKSYRLWEPKFTGELSFHGQTRPIVGTIERNGRKTKAIFNVKVTDFGVAKPSHLGVGMEEIIRAVVEFEYE